MSHIAFRLAALAVFAGAFMPTELPAQKKQPDKLGQLMKRKLTCTQEVLAGVAMNDFDQIGKNAKELAAISKQLEWRVLRTPLYQMYTDEFRRAAEDLEGHAKRKNIDAAALSYVELTLTCVRCHKHVRETRTARLD